MSLYHVNIPFSSWLPWWSVGRSVISGFWITSTSSTLENREMWMCLHTLILEAKDCEVCEKLALLYFGNKLWRCQNTSSRKRVHVDSNSFQEDIYMYIDIETIIIIVNINLRGSSWGTIFVRGFLLFQDVMHAYSVIIIGKFRVTWYMNTISFFSE